MKFTADELDSIFDDGGEKAVLWIRFAETALDPDSDCPIEIRNALHFAAVANLTDDLAALMGMALRLLAATSSVADGDNTSAARLSGIFTAIEWFGAVQAGAGNIEYDPKYFPS